MFQTFGGGRVSGSFSDTLAPQISRVQSAIRFLAVAGLVVFPATAFATPVSYGSQSSQSAQSSIFGSWSVVAVINHHRETRSAPEINKSVVISSSAYTDPFSSDCRSAASYPARSISWRAAKTLFHLPTTLNKYRPSSGMVADTRLTCAAVPVARILFLSRGRALYLAETEVYLMSLRPVG